MFRLPRSAAFATLIALVQAPAMPALAQQAGQGVTVQAPWARASAGGQAANGAAYLTLSAAAPNRLVSASTPAAERVELHEVINDHGVMRMRPVTAIPVAPDKPATLAPGGLHIMLLNLRQPLRQGQSFPLTLAFAEGPPVTVEVPVRGVGAMDAGSQGGASGGGNAHPGPRH